MCCHTNSYKKGVLDALRLADPKLTAGGEDFWHAGNAADQLVTPDAVTRTLDSVWLAVTTSHEFESLTHTERLAATQAWLDARTDAMDDPSAFGARALAALQAYEDQLIRREQRRETGAKVRRIGTASVVGGLLVSIGMMAGAAQPSGDANAEALFTQPEVTQSEVISAPAVRSIEGTVKTPSGQTVVFTAPTLGRCDAGTVAKTIKKTHTVTWQTKNGRLTQKVVKKGQKVCRVSTSTGGATGSSSSGYSSAVSVNADGVITKVDLPKNPTVQDIKNLGLTRDSRIDPSVDLPQPVLRADELPRTADAFRPVSSVKNPDGTLSVTFAVDGGVGILSTGRETVNLNPNGSATFTRTYDLSSSHRDDVKGWISVDLGQDDLPPSATSLWDIPSTNVMAKNIDTRTQPHDLSSWTVRTDGSVYFWDGSMLYPS